MFKKVKKYGIIFIIFSLSIFLYSCTDSTKKVTLSENTGEDILVEEDEIAEYLNTAKKLLSDNQFTEANDLYNKALSLDNTNKDLYIKIKDDLLNLNRYEDAYTVIRKAIDNNVDVENMKSVLKDISDKFEIIKLSSSIYQNSNYSLPQQVTTMISGEEVNIPVSWENPAVDTSNIGTFNFQGYNEKYGRSIVLDLTVIENVYDKQIGSINKTYTSNGKTYIDVDLVEFYTGEEALAEAKKDNAAAYDETTGEYFLPFGNYIRNNYSTITTYEVSKDSIYQLYFLDLFALGYDSESQIPELNTVSYETFKSYIDMIYKMQVDYGHVVDGEIESSKTTLCWIELKNNKVQSIYRKYAF
ncbi:MAG: Ig-like domain-containing protein [Clostridium sp.]|uniref:Ig-like domain-containing protein n=1 Tax=Clostridium sp. TaxID=1506 RepID=UPI00290854BE|nr:Ig-like domain-containing protein [Clostridium sp.]MDU5110277.1 Ig-like domain-containing protein [Clostridium sp.]